MGIQSLISILLVSRVFATVATEDELGIPYLSGVNHTESPGGPTRGMLTTVAWLKGASATFTSQETPIAIRGTWFFELGFSNVIAATKIKKAGVPGIGMLDRFRREDGSFGLPEYRLTDAQLSTLHADEAKLDEYRCIALITSMYHWTQAAYPMTRLGGMSKGFTAKHDDMMRLFYEELKIPGPQRTNHFFADWGQNTEDAYVFDVMGNSVGFGDGVPSPQSIGRAVGAQLTSESRLCRDGWNMCGDEQGSGQLHRVAFKDVTGYKPSYSKTNPTAWAPLMECTNGFCYRQEFVTPQIGWTAETLYINQEERLALIAEQKMEPIANYKEEIEHVLDRVKSIADNEEEKTLISWFDNKLKLAQATYLYLAAKYSWKMEDLFYFTTGYTMLEQDGLIVNWGAKVANNHVRPTTVAQDVLKDESVENWYPGAEGTKEYPANQWTPYIRVMPHGEFPSGSACICSSAMKWSAEGMRVGYDEDFTIEFEHEVGSNFHEPRLPTKKFTAKYKNWKEVADKCGTTRVDGGMHFRHALEPANQACTHSHNMHDKGVAFQKYIWTGNDAFLEPFGGLSQFGSPGVRDHKYRHPFPEYTPTKCDHSDDCAMTQYCSPNTNMCERKKAMGEYCNVVQKCSSGECMNRECV